MSLTDSMPEVKKDTDVVSQKVLIKGSAISGDVLVYAISVNTVHNKISTATVVLHDGDFAAREFALSNADTFTPGNDIEIELGYHGKTETVFKGIIVKHTLRAKQNGSSFLFVEAKNEAIKLTIGRKNKYFFDKTDSDIFSEISDDSGLDLDADDTSLSHKAMVQYYVTDWDFILQRAEANGMLVLTDFEKLVIKKPDASSSPLLTATFGDNIFEFESEMDARQQFSSIKSYSWNSEEQKIEESAKGSSSFADNGNVKESDLADVIGLDELSLHHAGFIKDEELNEWANAYAMKSKLSKICGKVKVEGTTKVKPGAVIKLQGISDRFNGNFFVTGVQQQFSVNNWFTEIQFGWNNEWFYKNEDIIEKTSSGLVPGMNGLHTGIVTKLEDDPEGNYRIKVRIPLIDEDEEGIWARVATLDAGNERGSFFLPEVDDEVVLGFINDDPRQAIVLGMLNSKANPAAVTASDENDEKGFYTRSKMKLSFDDKKSSVTIMTPKKKSIVINDDDGSIILKDELNNKITMNKDGITIESAKDINLKATGKVVAEGTSKLELTSKGQTILKGLAVNIN